ncbi:MAG: hypothetical protein ACTSX9_09470 [Candidatus Njordarchaeales archaeon]
MAKKRFKRIFELRRPMKNITVKVRVMEKRGDNEVFSKITGKFHRFTEYIVGDDTGLIPLVLWEDNENEIRVGLTYRLVGVDVKIFNDAPRIIVKRDTIIEESESIDESMINIGISSSEKKKR